MRARSLKSPSPWWKRGFFARLQVEFLFILVCRGLVSSGSGWQEDVFPLPQFNRVGSLRRLLTRLIWFGIVGHPLKLILQVILDRAPTRQNLFKRRVISNQVNFMCPIREENVESVDHLFVTCRVVSGVWYRVCRWLGWEWVLPRNLQELLHMG